MALTPTVLPSEADKLRANALGNPAPGMTVPRLIAEAAPDAARTFLEFFTARIANANTREAYGRAVARFLRWCEDRHIGIRDITTLHVAAYIRAHRGSAPTVRQHLAAIRMLCGWLQLNQIIRDNPAASVKGPKHVVVQGSTPVLPGAEAQKLLDSIETDTLKGLRDLALVSVMLYSFARISATLGMDRPDYSMRGSQAWLRLHEKGGKRLAVPAHHKAAEALDEYTGAAGMGADDSAPLFQSLIGRSDVLSGKRLLRRNALKMIKRRALAAGVDPNTCCHTFRATGITAYLANHGTLEHAQRIAAHASPRTTKLYDRTPDHVTVTEIEKIVLK